MSIFRKLALAFVLAIASTPTVAAEHHDFDRAAFVAAQEQGKPILVEVAAWWCPVCMSQQSSINAITKSAEFDNLVIFKINYDRQKEEWQQFGVTKQGALIGYKGKAESGRINFQTDREMIRRLLTDTVK